MFNFRQREVGKKFDKQVWDEDRLLGDNASITERGQEKVEYALDKDDYPKIVYSDNIIGSKIEEIRVLGIEDEYVQTAAGRKASYDIDRDGEVPEERKKVRFKVEVVTEGEKTYEDHNEKVFNGLSKKEKVLVLIASVKDRIVWPDEEDVPVIPYEESRGNWERIRVDDHEAILRNISLPSHDPPSEEEVRSVLNESFNN